MFSFKVEELPLGVETAMVVGIVSTVLTLTRATMATVKTITLENRLTISPHQP
ncbi:MAG: hypothetical protein LVS60_03005 [Nodosilinea sp. LVE1205-7]